MSLTNKFRLIRFLVVSYNSACTGSINAYSLTFNYLNIQHIKHIPPLLKYFVIFECYEESAQQDFHKVERAIPNVSKRLQIYEVGGIHMFHSATM